nr:MAG TPA: hypothetical protein [Caudoviricetes sp.]
MRGYCTRFHTCIVFQPRSSGAPTLGLLLFYELTPMIHT